MSVSLKVKVTIDLPSDRDRFHYPSPHKSGLFVRHLLTEDFNTSTSGGSDVVRCRSPVDTSILSEGPLRVFLDPAVVKDRVKDIRNLGRVTVLESENIVKYPLSDHR